MWPAIKSSWAPLIYMFITKSEINLEINFAYIEFSYTEVRLYRSNLEGPFDFDITGVDCSYLMLFIWLRSYTY